MVESVSKGGPVSSAERIIWAVAILLFDLIVVVPFMAVLAAYVLIARPPWFKTWVMKLYEDA